MFYKNFKFIFQKLTFESKHCLFLQKQLKQKMISLIQNNWWWLLTFTKTS